MSKIGITKIKSNRTGPVFNPKLEFSLTYKKRTAIKVRINPITMDPVSPMNILNLLERLYLTKPNNTAIVLTAKIPIL